MKTSALNSSGEGLVYRGSFVLRRSSNGARTLESAPAPTGRMSSSGVLYQVTDYLGSVRAVVNGNSPATFESSNYNAFGARTAGASNSTLPSGSPVSLRYHYTGQEDQTDFNLPYTDFGARHYSPTLRRWLTPDPASENYYGTSPYAFCNNNPVNLVDPQGDTIRVVEHYQALFRNAIEPVFPDQSTAFLFDNNGNLSYVGDRSTLNYRQKKILDGLLFCINQTTVTNITFGQTHTVDETTIDTSKAGGAAIMLHSENANLSNNEIVVDPNAPSRVRVYEVTSLYYDTKNTNPMSGARFVENYIETNTTDRMFHEIGHVYHAGEPQHKVFQYNNNVRRILHMRKRVADQEHNRLVH